ncbi:zinc-binding dehydrogenase [Mycolicibacterium bacteremicum]|uniref:Alcohol dehydrogenase n=1 Tax=Mycolicibacterium bacteremicum TaxID=564198 RepID=A0A1W9YR35_MYCBA|nr:zinc-binding dehydrogenase [Mycolicibacterium bacteremicum]MCV7430113.1 zinc-binding dehydrogenase [Mycolicibacterium bacteremicum]ORA02551.1 alcohol dehydrogenase [Mycolicibacterium bacteremicum]
MKAVSCVSGELSVIDLPAPRPAAGQLLLDVRRCGICGSDLHAKDHADELTDVMAAVGYDDFMRGDTPVVLGHEFSGEVAERGRGVAKEFKTGTTVVSFPLLRASGGVHLTGLSPLAPGGYAEQVLAEASMTFVVPNGLDIDTAALTEPMAVALHAVRRSEIGRRDTAVVVGCGPVGLAVICHLKAKGVGTIIASDFSPGRRALAARCGAHVVVDPAVDSPYERFDRQKGVITAAPQLYELGVGSMEKLRKLPGWSHLYRVAESLGAAGPKRPVIFECVGVPGMIDGVLAAAPVQSRVVVVGVCMGEDRFRPTLAIGKEIDLRFVFGYTPLEFRDTLYLLAEGKVDASALVTGTVGLDGVDAAFRALSDPEAHAKVLIDPRSSAVEPG